MRLGFALCRSVCRATSVQRTLLGYRGLFFTFKSKEREVDRLQSELKSALQNPDKTPAARAHLALASVFLTEKNPAEAVTHASESYQLLQTVAPKPLALLLDSSRTLVEALTLCDKYEEALRVAEESVTYARQLFKPDDIQLARTLYGLSFLKASSGKPADAESLCIEVIKILRPLSDKNFLADALKSLGVVYMSIGQFSVATKYIGEAANILQNLENREQLPSVLLTLADAYYADGRLRDVSETCQKALTILKTDKSNNLDFISQCLEKLMTVSMSKGDFDAAEKYAKEKTEIDPKVHPDDTELHGANWFMLGSIYVQSGKGKEARASFEQSVSLLTTVSPMRIKAVNMLCKTCLSLEDFDAANTHADTMMKEVGLVRAYPDLAGIYSDYGMVKERKGEDAAALQAYRKCIELEGERPSDSSAFAYINMGQIYAKEGDFAKGSEAYAKGIDLYVTRSEGDSPEVAVLMHNLGLMQSSAEAFEAAAGSFVRSLEAKVKLFGEKDDSVIETRQALASVYARQQKYAEAEVQLRKSLETSEGDQAKSLAAMLGLVLEQQGKAAEVEEIVKKYKSS